MINWLNTIRWKNLIIIWISVLFVILPHYELIQMRVLFYEFIRWAIVCSSVAAIGNITNDWLDVKQDRENKKKNIFVNRSNLGKAIILIIALAICIITAIYFSNLRSSFIFLSCLALTLLLCYNTFLKRLPLIGNLVIALLTGLIFFGIDLIAMSRIIYFEAGISTKQIELLGLFAFLTTFIREILKDAEDRKGDLFAGFHTIARYLKDKWIAILIVFIHVAGCVMIYAYLNLRHTNYTTPFILYTSWCSLVTVGSAIFMLIPHPSRYVRSTRIIKAGMLGCLVIYLFLSL